MAALTLCLSGDVMLGRGIDQVLRHPSPAELHEAIVKDATVYIQLAERANGPIPRQVSFDYVWGDALDELERVQPDAHIINLETAVTQGGDWLPKGINYRMHPANLPCLTAFGVDCAVLANNHVLDYGRVGLTETLDSLRDNAVQTAGAGEDFERARTPAIIPTRCGRRVIVVALASESSGVPGDWAATGDRSGVYLLEAHADTLVAETRAELAAIRQPGDVAVVSIHWGGNWGYRVPDWQRDLAHALIDEAGIDVVHGHSSHHPKGIEVHRGRPILYGCGDLLNDYEGIRGHEEYRGDLTCLYFVSLDSSGELLDVRMTPFRIRRFRLERATRTQAHWLHETLKPHYHALASRIALEGDVSLKLRP